MLEWLARRRNGSLLGVLVLAQVLMVGHQVQERPIDASLRYWSSALFMPFQRACQWGLSGLSSVWSGYVWLVGTAAENRRLDAEVSRLRLENHYLQQEVVQVSGRAVLDDFRASLAARTLPAKVIARGPSRSAREVFLDRGREHGIRPGMAVVGPAGVVGGVEEAHGAFSIVVLLSDAEAGAGVVLGRSGALGVLRGTNGAVSRIDYVPPHVGVAVGEQVYTSGLDGVFPPGMPVGEVVSVETTPEMHTIAVNFHTDLDRIREVAVVLQTEHAVLPDSVRQILAQLPEPSEPGVEGELRAGSGDGPADRVKRTYEIALEAQRKTIGLLSGRPPNFSAAADSLRAARGEMSGASGEAE
ncbi:MAG: rod shape-determining protein MreC [Bryobacterales bacterium]|nr:rod shape-determining protein MreC [Bryobacterales bacterium]